MAAQSSILAWRIPWPEEPGGLQSMGSQRVHMTEVTEHACGAHLTCTEQAVPIRNQGSRSA